ncbi:aliphatic sulfonate ABC transporter substrate-binding protein [Planosporangium mesophilum]|uniref:Putative aliphatic sulfonates-binding protein n=1 Tax=Planosporangium mesophilum TaxID=689768 RepID=A0A8J3TC23_9ACTN|nr:aliphatic sulfonate ABC transporter substrate-binding protein [Planosporangium mesophilum]NJC83885.1 aliphatic sulfonate ABC transporter substrate-binding protein [Planosporangium mesophilum]GII22756.1 sulfonate ABC transporter substrate-binding protein [Planosporangium mesophilum]
MHTRATMRRIGAALVGLLAAAAVSAVAGCANGESHAAGASGPLRVGYQRYGSESLVKARNAGGDAAWSLFESGPALTEALKAGAIDIGETGEAPPVFAAAAKADFKVIATSAPVPRGEAVLVHDSSGFTSFADLKGRTIALNKGSNVHWLLVRLLAANHLSLSDVNIKYLKPAEGRAAFDNGQVDAWIIWDPYFALAEQPGVKVLVDATGLAGNREYILASPEALRTKPDKIRQFLVTLRQTTDWGIANPDERARVLAPELKIDESVAKRSLDRSAKALTPVTPDIAAELQDIADGFTGLKLIPGKVDMKGRIDDRYTAVLR